MSEREPVTFETVCEMALALPGVERATAYRTPALKVRKKILARLREDEETLAIMMDFGDREFRLQTTPEVFYVTDHYAGYPMILVHLSKIDPNDLHQLIQEAWHLVAPKSLLKQA